MNDIHIHIVTKKHLCSSVSTGFVNFQFLILKELKKCGPELIQRVNNVLFLSNSGLKSTHGLINWICSSKNKIEIESLLPKKLIMHYISKEMNS